MGDNTPKKTRGNPENLSPAWEKGKSGNPKGRPKGSKNKLGEAFLSDMYDAWKTQGKSVITDVIEQKPDVFLRVVASVLPKDLNLNVTNDAEGMTDDEIKRELRDIADSLASFGIVATGTTGKASRSDTSEPSIN